MAPPQGGSGMGGATERNRWTCNDGRKELDSRVEHRAEDSSSDERGCSRYTHD